MRPFKLSRSPSKMFSYQSRAAAGSADRRCRWWKPSHSVSSTTSIFVPHGSSTKASLKRPSISRIGLENLHAGRLERRHLRDEVGEREADVVDPAADARTGRLALEEDDLGVAGGAGVVPAVVGAPHVGHVPLLRLGGGGGDEMDVVIVGGGGDGRGAGEPGERTRRARAACESSLSFRVVVVQAVGRNPRRSWRSAINRCSYRASSRRAVRSIPTRE